MAPTSNIFWCKVVFQKFIKHFRKMTDEQIVRDVRQSMDDLEDLVPDTDTFGACMVRWALERSESPFATAARENGKKGGRPRKNTAGAPNGNNGDESATACENMRRVPQNEDPSHGFSGGYRPAQGSMSLPPSGAAHDGNNLGSARPSTDGDTRKDSRNIIGFSNGASLESATSVDNDLGSAKAHSVCNTGSVQPVTRRESGKFEVTTKKPLAGGLPPSSSLKPSASSGAVDVLNLAYSGEFQNVKLTQEQYNELGIKFGNQQKLNRAIDSLSSKLENDEIKPPPKNHYAVLVKWAAYRDDMDEKEELKAATLPHYETVSEHNRRVLENGRKWIDEHFPKKEAANG